MIEASVELEIPFFDVDSMGITWHGNYIKYFEMGRCALLDKIGYGYSEMEKSGFGWPVVDMRIKYVRPTYFKQKITVIAKLIEYEHRLKIEYLVKDSVSQEKLTSAYSVQMAVNLKTQETCFKSPDILLEKVKKYV